jgi:hypothetical protein
MPLILFFMIVENSSYKAKSMLSVITGVPKLQGFIKVLSLSVPRTSRTILNKVRAVVEIIACQAKPIFSLSLHRTSVNASTASILVK